MGLLCVCGGGITGPQLQAVSWACGCRWEACQGPFVACALTEECGGFRVKPGPLESGRAAFLVLHSVACLIPRGLATSRHTWGGHSSPDSRPFTSALLATVVTSLALPPSPLPMGRIPFASLDSVSPPGATALRFLKHDPAFRHFLPSGTAWRHVEGSIRGGQTPSLGCRLCAFPCLIPPTPPRDTLYPFYGGGRKGLRGELEAAHQPGRGGAGVWPPVCLPAAPASVPSSEGWASSCCPGGQSPGQCGGSGELEEKASPRDPP